MNNDKLLCAALRKSVSSIDLSLAEKLALVLALAAVPSSTVQRCVAEILRDETRRYEVKKVMPTPDPVTFCDPFHRGSSISRRQVSCATWEFHAW